MASHHFEPLADAPAGAAPRLCLPLSLSILLFWCLRLPAALFYSRRRSLGVRSLRSCCSTTPLRLKWPQICAQSVAPVRRECVSACLRAHMSALGSAAFRVLGVCFSLCDLSFYLCLNALCDGLIIRVLGLLMLTGM